MTRLVALTAAIILASPPLATGYERIVVAVGPVPITLDHPRQSLTIRPKSIAGSVGIRTAHARAVTTPVTDSGSGPVSLQEIALDRDIDCRRGPSSALVVTGKVAAQPSGHFCAQRNP